MVFKLKVIYRNSNELKKIEWCGKQESKREE